MRRRGEGGEEEEGEEKLTNKRQPHKLETNDGEDGEGDPEDGLAVDGEPEEAAVCRVDGLGAGFAALEDPVAVAGGGVDLVPPAQADEAAASDVLEVVEVHGQQQDGDDEDHDHVIGKDDAEEVDEEGGYAFVDLLASHASAGKHMV